MNCHIVIPAYNESATIGRVVGACRSACPQATILVVDDGSTDVTVDTAHAAGARVLIHEINRGQGAALATGTAWALYNGADVIVHFDADNQLEASDIVKATELLVRDDLDVVLGSRFVQGAQVVNMPGLKRWIINPVARIINRLFTGVTLTDAHNGFRVLTRKAAEHITIVQDRMAHNSEIGAQLRTQRLRFCEMPVTVRYHEFGQGIEGGVRIVKDLLLGKFV